MKIKFAITCFTLAALLTPMATRAADSDSDRSHPMTYVKDSVITTKVKAKLADEKMSSLAHISVDTDNKGVVVLSGNVKTQADSDKAASIARGTEGVTGVKNELRIKKEEQAAAPKQGSY